MRYRFVLLTVLLSGAFFSCKSWMTVERSDDAGKNSHIKADKVSRQAKPSEIVRMRPDRSLRGKMTFAAPVDPSIIQGALDNGVHYYLANPSSGTTGNTLALVVRHGSAHEPAAYPGLAHVLAHVMEDNYHRIISGDAGPFTHVSYDALQCLTSYKSKREAENILHFLHLTASDLPLETATIDRAKREAMHCSIHPGTTQDSLIARTLYQGSPYASHLPYYRHSSIRTIPDDTIRQHYKVWFSPGSIAIIATGSFSRYEMVESLQKNFKMDAHRPTLLSPSKPHIPFHTKPRIRSIIDPEAAPGIQIIQFRPQIKHNTFDGYIKTIQWDFFEYLWLEEIKKVLPSGANPSIHFDKGVDGLDQCVIQITVPQSGEMENALRQVFSVHRKIKQKGFPQEEFETLKSSFLSDKKARLSDKNRASGRIMAYRLARHFLTGEAVPDAAQAWSAIEGSVLPLSPKEMQGLAKIWLTKRNRTILVRGPKDSLPAESALQQLANEQ